MVEVANFLNRSPGVVFLFAIIGVMVMLLVLTTVSTRENSMRYLELKRQTKVHSNWNNCRLKPVIIKDELELVSDCREIKDFYGIERG